jgi:hypothetical protein
MPSYIRSLCEGIITLREAISTFNPCGILTTNRNAPGRSRGSRNSAEARRLPINAEVQAYLGSGVRRLAERPKRERTLSGLMEMLAMHSRQTELNAKAGRIDAQGISHPDRRLEELVGLHHQVRTALKPYTTAGEYGWLLDAHDDALQTGPLHTFEQRPVTRYVFHRLEQRFSTDTPTWLPNDEAAITWALPDFEKKGKQWLMTTAKKNVSLGV